MEMDLGDMIEQESTGTADISDEPTVAEQGEGKGKFLPVIVTVEPA